MRLTDGETQVGGNSSICYISCSVFIATPYFDVFPNPYQCLLPQPRITLASPYSSALSSFFPRLPTASSASFTTTLRFLPSCRILQLAHQRSSPARFHEIFFTRHHSRVHCWSLYSQRPKGLRMRCCLLLVASGSRWRFLYCRFPAISGRTSRGV